MGVNPLNAPVNVTIAVWPWGAYLGEDALEQGVRRAAHGLAPTAVSVGTDTCGSKPA